MVYKIWNYNPPIKFAVLFIEDPPFNFYKRFLLDENESLKTFFDTLFLKLESENKTDTALYNKTTKGNSERLYSLCLSNLPKNETMSEKTVEIIMKRYETKKAKKLISYCKSERMTVRFTDDITRYKKIEIN